MAKYKIAEIQPNTARCGYSEYSQTAFDELSKAEREDLYELARSIGGVDGAVQLPVLERLPKPMGEKKYRTRDGDRRILATLAILRRKTVQATVRKFKSSFSTTALAAQRLHRGLSPIDRLRNCYQAVQDDGKQRTAEMTGISEKSLVVYMSYWTGVAPEARTYCQRNGARVTMPMIAGAVGDGRRGDAEAQLIFLKAALGDGVAKTVPTARKTFRAADVGEMLTRIHNELVSEVDEQYRDVVSMTVHKIHAELTQMFAVRKKGRPSKKATVIETLAEVCADQRESTARTKTPRKTAARRPRRSPQNGSDDELSRRPNRKSGDARNRDPQARPLSQG